MTWQQTIARWGRDRGATHAMLEGAGRRRRLAIRSIPDAIRRVHGDQLDAQASRREVAIKAEDHTVAVVYLPARRVQIGVDRTTGRPDYRFEVVA